MRFSIFTEEASYYKNFNEPSPSIIGRPKKLTNEQIEWAKAQLKNDPKPTRTALAKALNVSPKTLKRALEE